MCAQPPLGKVVICKSFDTAKIQESAHVMEMAKYKICLCHLYMYLIGQFHHVSAFLNFISCVNGLAQLTVDLNWEVFVAIV